MIINQQNLGIIYTGFKASFQQGLGNFNMAFFAGPMERSAVITVGGIHIRAGAQQCIDDAHMATQTGKMKR